MNHDAAPLADRARRSPFISAGTVASSTGRPASAVLSQLRRGAIPGYKFGAYWFVPGRELDELVRQRGGHESSSPDGIVAHLLQDYPLTLSIVDLEHFFGLQRPYIYRVLRSPLLASYRRDEGIRRPDLAHALAQARNAYAPDSRPRRGR